MKSVFLRGLLPPIGGLCLHPAAASQQVFFEMIPLLPGERHSLTEIFCSLVYCMQFYRQTDESVLVSCFLESLLFGVFCPVCVCVRKMCVSVVRVRLPISHMFLDTLLFLLFSPG